MFIEIHKKSNKYCYKDRGLSILHNPHGSGYLNKTRYKLYVINGKLHNELGPTVIYSNGTKSYYLNDKYYSHDKWLEQINKKE